MLKLQIEVKTFCFCGPSTMLEENSSDEHDYDCMVSGWKMKALLSKYKYVDKLRPNQQYFIFD